MKFSPSQEDSMQISGEYGTELLLRYSEDELMRKLERRRVAEERDDNPRGEAEPARRAAEPTRRGPGSRLARIARFFLRGNTPAGGPEWIRPALPEAAGPEQAPALLEPAHTVALVLPEDIPAANEDQERMPALAGSRR